MRRLIVTGAILILAGVAACGPSQSPSEAALELAEALKGPDVPRLRHLLAMRDTASVSDDDIAAMIPEGFKAMTVDSVTDLPDTWNGVHGVVVHVRIPAHSIEPYTLLAHIRRLGSARDTIDTWWLEEDGELFQYADTMLLAVVDGRWQPWDGLLTAIALSDSLKELGNMVPLRKVASHAQRLLADTAAIHPYHWEYISRYASHALDRARNAVAAAPLLDSLEISLRLQNQYGTWWGQGCSTIALGSVRNVSSQGIGLLALEVNAPRYDDQGSASVSVHDIWPGQVREFRKDLDYCYGPLDSVRVVHIELAAKAR